MATTAEAGRGYQGAAIFSYGFRPFFLGSAIWAAAAMVLFTLMLGGTVTLPSTFGPADWHIHELLYGFLPGVVAGFLLTAIPNWTGRLPVTGRPLAALFALWIAGRLAVALSAWIGPIVSAAVDLLFLLALALIAGREIIAGNNKRNLKVLALIALLWFGNLVFHIEVSGGGTADYGKRIGIAAAIMLIVLIGGRIVPTFTRNWLAKLGPDNLPAPFERFDLAAIASSALGFVAWVLMPASPITAALCALAGVLQLARLARWKGYRTLAEPMVTILHIGYLFVPTGFVLMAAAIAFPGAIPAAAAIHAWTAGAIGVMTLAVMTRASLGHTGHALAATPSIIGIYACAVLSAGSRIASALGFAPQSLLHLAAMCWILAFGGFALAFGPMLLRPRQP